MEEKKLKSNNNLEELQELPILINLMWVFNAQKRMWVTNKVMELLLIKSKIRLIKIYRKSKRKEIESWEMSKTLQL